MLPLDLNRRYFTSILDIFTLVFSSPASPLVTLSAMLSLIMLLSWTAVILSDPVEEIEEMERIMMTLFPYNMVLNPRVGPDQLAVKLANVFGVDYTPEKSKADLLDKVRPKAFKPKNKFKQLYFAQGYDQSSTPKESFQF